MFEKYTIYVDKNVSIENQDNALQNLKHELWKRRSIFNINIRFNGISGILCLKYIWKYGF